MDLKFHLRHEKAVLPTRANSTDAGLDLVAAERMVFSDSEAWYETGLAVEIPEGFVGLIAPRSSISTTGLTLANSIGVIDSGYRGTIQVRFRRVGGPRYNQYYLAGDRVAQLLIVPVILAYPVLAEELSESERGEGGFGSTGR